MLLIRKKLGEIKPYERNAKDHPKEQVEQIANSIIQFGNNDPIAIDEDGVIIEGHGRYMALTALGYEEADCIVLSGLTEEQKNAYRLVHNQLTMNSGWDEELLKAELETIGLDMASLGFPEDILDDAFDREPEEDGFDVDGAVAEIEEPKTKRGDLYRLGDHYLLCGDSTDAKDVGKLMGETKADMVFTDPPYNIDYEGIRDKRKIRNDKMSDENFVEFLKASIPFADTAYVCCSWQYSHLFKKALTEKGMAPKAMIVWDKVNPAQHLDKYFKQHELIYYYGKFGGEETLRGDVWQLKRQKNTLHPTMKPIELIAIALNDNPDKKIIYDGFGGSGSTLIACEQLGRKCRMMEFDPKYCDVIVRRWETLTGRKAELL